MAERETGTTAAPAATPGSGLLQSGEQPSDGPVPGIGSVVAGKYRIEGVLGRGGMGVVASGRQLELDRAVAIKFLKRELALDARPLQRFAREARLIAKMRSEHVVRVFDIGRENGVPYIVMEHLNGCDLAREIARGPLSVERAVELVLHACEALGEAHSLGIIHRDVKPSNLFLAEGFGGRRTLKVLDFGISKWLLPVSDSDTPLVTTDAGAVGTPAFASPEQLTRPEAIDGRTDVWALGVVLYQALSGKLPFTADTIPALYSQIIGKAPAPFPNEREVPAALVAVIMRCLSRSPEDRFPNMLELARALLPYAPPHAKQIVDSLATLPPPAPEEGRAGGASEAGLSPLATTLELGSHSTPDATVASRLVETPPPRRGPWGPLLVIVAVAAAAVVTLRPRSQDTSPTPKESAVTSAAESPPSESKVENVAPRLEPPRPEVPAVPEAAPAVSSAAIKSKRPPPVAQPRSSAAKNVASAEPATPASATPATSARDPNPGEVVPLYRH